MPVNRWQFVQLVLLVSALPAQYMLTEWLGSTSESTRTKSVQEMLLNLKNFRASHLSLSSWKSWLKTIIIAASEGTLFSFGPKDGKKDSTFGECIATEVFRYNNLKGHFSNSLKVRSPRPNKVKYRVGQVIKHKVHGYRGVIVGWDDFCKAPREWIDVMHGSNISIQRQPHYSVLVDKRDRTEIQTTYVAQENIITQTNVEVKHPAVWDYFDFYDGAQYHMRPAMQDLYPYD